MVVVVVVVVVGGTAVVVTGGGVVAIVDVVRSAPAPTATSAAPAVQDVAASSRGNQKSLRIPMTLRLRRQCATVAGHGAGVEREILGAVDLGTRLGGGEESHCSAVDGFCVSLTELPGG